MSDDGAHEEQGITSETAGVDLQVPVLRISQLDSLELDTALEQLVWTQFSQCFQNCRPGLLTPLEPELKALLQLLVWRFTLCSSSTTVGQSILSLCYHDSRSSSAGYKPLSSRQKLALALHTVGPRWLQERSHSILRSFGLTSGSPVSGGHGFHRCLRVSLTLISALAQLASLINFLVFLRKGQHPVLAERLVGCRAVFSKPNVIRDITYQYMNRELLWHGFAEFLIFLLPIINSRKLKDSVQSVLFGKQSSSAGKAQDGTWKECAFCGEWPTMPHAIGCRHVFCYYCIKSHSIANTYITCPKCNAEAGWIEPVSMRVERVGRH